MKTWDLKLCPHCSSRRVLIRVIEREYLTGEDEYYVRCNSCGSSGGKRLSPEAAVTLWNDRKEGNDVQRVVEADGGPDDES